MFKKRGNRKYLKTITRIDLLKTAKAGRVNEGGM